MEEVRMWGYSLLPELQHFIINNDSFNHVSLQQLYTCMNGDDYARYDFILDHSNPFVEDELQEKAAKILLLHNEYYHFHEKPCKVYPHFKTLGIVTIEQCRLDTECDLISISNLDKNKVLPLIVDMHSYINVWCLAHFNNQVPFPINQLFMLTLAANMQLPGVDPE